MLVVHQLLLSMDTDSSISSILDEFTNDWGYLSFWLLDFGITVIAGTAFEDSFFVNSSASSVIWSSILLTKAITLAMA